MPLLPPNRSGIFGSSNKMADSQTLRTVLFRVGDLVCALPAGIVREVLPPLPPTRIPGAADPVHGLVNVRGALLTVIDAHRLLNRAVSPDDEGAIVVVEHGARGCGLLVGQVLDFLQVPADAIASRDQLPGVDARVARAVGRWGGHHFVLLDLDTLLVPLLGRADPGAA
jgi:purine-binding chemotaxis protein CheW